MKENKYEKDVDFIHLINELRRIKTTNSSKEMIYDFGRIYNDANNHLIVFYKINGMKAMEIIDEMIEQNEK